MINKKLFVCFMIMIMLFCGCDNSVNNIYNNSYYSNDMSYVTNQTSASCASTSDYEEEISSAYHSDYTSSYDESDYHNHEIIEHDYEVESSTIEDDTYEEESIDYNVTYEEESSSESIDNVNESIQDKIVNWAISHTSDYGYSYGYEDGQYVCSTFVQGAVEYAFDINFNGTFNTWNMPEYLEQIGFKCIKTSTTLTDSDSISGDILITNSKYNHTIISLGNNYFIGAENSNRGIIEFESSWYGDNVFDVWRYIGFKD